MKFVRTLLIIAVLIAGWAAVRAESVAHPAALRAQSAP